MSAGFPSATSRDPSDGRLEFRHTVTWSSRESKRQNCYFQILPLVFPMSHCKQVFLTKRPLTEPSTLSSEYLPVNGGEEPISCAESPSQSKPICVCSEPSKTVETYKKPPLVIA